MGSLAAIASIADLRVIARRRLPRPIFDWLDGGAFEERTLKANTADFEKLNFRQRVGVDISEMSLATTLMGQSAAMPVVISPTGMAGIVRDGGNAEIYAARAAAAAGIPYTLGMVSITPIERIRQEIQNFWFQICMIKDRGVFRDMIGRAHDAGCPVLVLTMTWPIPTQIQLR